MLVFQIIPGAFRTPLIACALFATVTHAQDASLDPTFSGNGYTVETIAGTHDRPNGITVQADGKIVVCGTDETFRNNQMLLARFTAAGILDASFSGDGKLAVPIGVFTDNTGAAVLIQPDGKILVAGSESNMDGRRMTVVRLNANGALHTSFGTNGRATIPMSLNGYSEALCMVRSDDGAIILGGTAFSQFNTPLMAKVDANGVEDLGFAQLANDFEELAFDVPSQSLGTGSGVLHDHVFVAVCLLNRISRNLVIVYRRSRSGFLVEAAG